MIKKKKRVVDIITLEDVNKRFYSQIMREYKSMTMGKHKVLNLRVLQKCPSYIKFCKFEESFYFTNEDWKKIRDKEYWKYRTLLKGIERDKYVLKRITDYKLKNTLD